MNSYRVRSVAPKTSDWLTLESDSVCDAAQYFHEYHFELGVAYVEDPESPGRSVNFMLLEVDPGGELVSRIYRSQMLRRGVRTHFPTTLEDIAQQLGWEHDPEELLASSWDGEQEEWT